MRLFFRSSDLDQVAKIQSLKSEFSGYSDAQLRLAAGKAKQLLPFIAIAAVAASRVLGQDMFDVQWNGTLALCRGSIAEMQTGEGKTLAAVPAIAWYARGGKGVHVMTVNDYLARRDAQWMGDVYKMLGFSVAYVQQGMSPEERRKAYASDITYATQNEIGFDVLRDRLALRVQDQVHREFSAAVIDEADSILIDEARIPLVIAGGDSRDTGLAFVADQVVRNFLPFVHYTVDSGAHNVAMTDTGIRAVETAFGCGNLFEERNLRLHTAVQDSLHAHGLLRRDVDYLVKNGAIEMVDEFKGRIALDRRWPAGLHTAVEAKEGVTAKSQGTVLGSTTLQHLVALYPQVCGMTGTAATQALELEKVYGMKVEVIPTNRPMIRVDDPDVVFATKDEKERAVVVEIRRAHASGQPILVGTGSVEESERLSRALDVPHVVLNARNDEAEAAIIARAGEPGAVTISTNMAGRGTDIRVSHPAGLYVIGTNRHESRRIDNQLRGRAGRQGDPGRSRFFVSLEDPLLVKYRELGNDPETVQRLVEGQHLDQRLFLHGYDVPVEGQRNRVHTLRASYMEDPVTLLVIDDLWADYLEKVADYKAGAMWQSYMPSAPVFVSLDRRDPHLLFLRQIHEWFGELWESIPGEIESRRVAGGDAMERGAVWTYLTTDQPFGSWTERVLKGMRRKAAEWGLGGP